jgi:hypothetical protein
MNSEANRLRHEKNVWRGIAIGLAATLVLLLSLGGVAALLMVARSRQEAVRAEIAMVEAAQQRIEAQAMEGQQNMAKLLDQQNEPITREQAIKIAEDHLKVNGRHDVNVNGKVDGGWRVTITPLPAVPGGHTTVVIDEKGKIVRVEPGE